MDEQLFRLAIALRGGSKRSPELLRELGISQPTLSRLIARAGDVATSFGRARATSYAALRDLRGIGSRIPIYRVTQEGTVVPSGKLVVLAAGQFGLETKNREQLFDGLPYFLRDMQPQGFLGRVFPKVNADLCLPERITDWRDDDVLYALARRGEDCVGNLIVGDESLDRFYRALAVNTIDADDRNQRYIELANQSMAGTLPGSSAGGEQPKFTATVTRCEGKSECVIVKFSPADDSGVSARWRDLLIAEHHALAAISKCGFASARSEIVLTGNRVFLEVARFDRVGMNGRRGLISLGAIDDEFLGKRDNWVKAAARLEAADMISAKDAKALRFQAVFGQMIGNTDQHFGNASLITDAAGEGVYQLAPAYDVLPMLYAPVSGELVPRAFTPPMPNGDTEDVWALALATAIQYWRFLASESLLSGEFRQIAAENAGVLEKYAPVAKLDLNQLAREELAN
jgi:hypothetical protein